MLPATFRVCGWLRLVALTGVLAQAPSASAGLPLHLRIDDLIGVGEPEFEATAAVICTDAAFLRRVSLDLAGTIPTARQARAFVDDPASDKRVRLIDSLLGSAQYARRMQRVFDRMLMERRRNQHVPAGQWQGYLFAAFRENKPWDRLVAEILLADGADPQTRPAAKFYLDRQGEADLLVRDVGRIFLGRDMQCAQCHDHPLVDDYLQEQYYGLKAFFNRSFLFTDKKKKAIFAEKADGEVTFKSVFDPDTTHKTGPKLPFLKSIQEPTFPKGMEYEVKPAKGVRPIPKFSRREQLAAQMVRPENQAFRRNIVNRLWALMMGRGIVEPVDMFHGANPPTHPKLLDLLADEFAGSGFDIKWLLRELALTTTYQRSSETPADVSDAPAPETFAVASIKPLSPEQLGWTLMESTGLAENARQQIDAKLKSKDPKFYPFLRVNDTWSEQTLYDTIDRNLSTFVSLYGPPAGQPDDGFQATAEQALFVKNGSVVESWIRPSGNNLVARLQKLTEPSGIAEELFLSVLTRRPSTEETQRVADYLSGRDKDKKAALEELAWALVACAEFRFNH